MRQVLGQRVRRDFQPTRRADAVDAAQLAELRHHARLVAAVERPRDARVGASHIAPDGEPEGVRIGRGEAQLTERNPILGGPRILLHLRRHRPDGIPRDVFVAVVAHVYVALHAGRVDREAIAGAPVVVRVDHQVQPVRLRADVAAREERKQRIGARIEGAHEDVQVAVVVRHARLGAESERIAVLHRIELAEGVNDLRVTPGRVVIASIHDDGAGGARRLGDGRRRPRTAWIRNGSGRRSASGERLRRDDDLRREKERVEHRKAASVRGASGPPTRSEHQLFRQHEVAKGCRGCSLPGTLPSRCLHARVPESGRVP